VALMRLAALQPASLDAVIHDNDSNGMGDRVRDESSSPSDLQIQVRLPAVASVNEFDLAALTQAPEELANLLLADGA
jgi:hypothetical protein